MDGMDGWRASHDLKKTGGGEFVISKWAGGINMEGGSINVMPERGKGKPEKREARRIRRRGRLRRRV